MIEIADLLEGIQAPAASLPDEAEDGGDVVGEDRGTEPATVNQTRSLEDLFVLAGEIVSRERAGVFVGRTLVELQDLVCDILRQQA